MWTYLVQYYKYLPIVLLNKYNVSVFKQLKRQVSYTFQMLVRVHWPWIHFTLIIRLPKNMRKYCKRCYKSLDIRRNIQTISQTVRIPRPTWLTLDCKEKNYSSLDLTFYVLTLFLLECWTCGLRNLDSMINGSSNSTTSCQQQSSALGMGTRSVCHPGICIRSVAAFSRHRGAMLCHAEGSCSFALPAVGGRPAACGAHNQPDGPLHSARPPATKSQAQ